MKLTNDIIKVLRLTDLSTDEAVVARYDEIIYSPLLWSFSLHNNCANIREISEVLKGNSNSFTTVEAMTLHYKDMMRHYATTKRVRINKQALRAIKTRLAILFAKWEEEYSQKAEAGSLRNDEGMGFMWNYAVKNGLRVWEEAGGLNGSLNAKDKAALDLTAKRVLHTIEAYLLYCLTFREEGDTPDHGLLGTEEERVKAIEGMSDKARLQINLLYADEWEKSENRLTRTFEEEVGFLGEEENSYLIDFFEAIIGNKGLFQTYLPIVADKDTEEDIEETAADRERALHSRYKDYINI